MAKLSPKENPNLFFFGSMVDLDCNLQDIKLVLRKTEEIEFEDHPEASEELKEEGLIMDIFPSIARESFIVTLIIILESEFRKFCKLLREIEDISLKWTELRGSALDRFKIYCEKLSGLIVPNAHQNLCLVRGLIETRNCIIHSNASIENFGKANAVKEFANSIEGINIVRDQYLEFTYDACIQCSDIIMNFMQQWYDAALERYPKIYNRKPGTDPIKNLK